MSKYRVFLPTNGDFWVVNETFRQVQIGNSLLHFFDFKTEMSAEFEHNPQALQRTINLFPDDLGFLEILVDGTSETRRKTAELEARRSLAVFRFVYPMEYWNTGEVNHPALNLRVQGPSASHAILFELNENGSWNTQQSVHMQRLIITKNWLSLAIDSGLNDLNYHFEKSQNPMSQKIIHSLELYDSGLTALSDWQALYRYIASIETALPGGYSKKNKIAGRISNLMQNFGMGFVEPDSIHEGKTVWEINADRFIELYIRRNDLLHSHQVETSPQDREAARMIAYNVIRCMSYISREKNFQTDADALTWFEN